MPEVPAGVVRKEQVGVIAPCFGIYFDRNVEDCQKCKKKQDCAVTMVAINKEKEEKGGGETGMPKKKTATAPAAPKAGVEILTVQEMATLGHAGAKDAGAFYRITTAKKAVVDVRKNIKEGAIQVITHDPDICKALDAGGFKKDAKKAYTAYFVPKDKAAVAFKAIA